MAFDGIVFRDHAIPELSKWGDTGKLSDLTAEEIDLNFWELLSRLKALEDDPPTAVSIANILVVGTQMSFVMSDASTFGPFTLPIATFEFRDDFVGGTPYFELDIVTVPGLGVFLVRLDHTGVAPFDPDREISGDLVYFRIYADATGGNQDIPFFVPGLPGTGLTTGDAMAGYAITRPMTLPLNLAGSVGVLGVAADAGDGDPEYEIQVNGATVSSVVFLEEETTAQPMVSAAIDLVSGDRITVIYPTDGINATAKELFLTIVLVPTPAP